jgi:hypothetical protein
VLFSIWHSRRSTAGDFSEEIDITNFSLRINKVLALGFVICFTKAPMANINYVYIH